MNKKRACVFFFFAATSRTSVKNDRSFFLFTFPHKSQKVLKRKRTIDIVFFFPF